MIEQKKESIEIDICGQICPSSLLTSLREVNKHKVPLQDGTLQLDILTDHHDAINRICDAVGNMGYQVEVEDQKGHYKLSIYKMDARRLSDFRLDP